ncbi:hypothetical protein RND81_14G017700 [Saponaria officinalis]|uniref:Association with the SNF1 complex (ASC) domain-containing protein n=1 Tax=Saponaria officinalis TaxID=3572 RepID=A0AAW1GI27_SAPOF
MSTSITNEEAVTAVGYETPDSPDSGYDSHVYLWNGDDTRDPPYAPPHLQHTLSSGTTGRETTAVIPLTQYTTVNHMYIENREAPRSVVSLGNTYRFRSKFVTVVLYMPVQRGSHS